MEDQNKVHENKRDQMIFERERILQALEKIEQGEVDLDETPISKEALQESLNEIDGELSEST